MHCSLGEAVTFSTTDCSNGYWQVEIPKVDRDKTNFCSHNYLFRSIRMPFGLRNALASFYKALNTLLSVVKL